MIKLPIGSIVAWHKTLANNNGRKTPTGWVECDGIEKDIPVGSVYSVGGKFTPPDLRGVFIRGSATSGVRNISVPHRHYVEQLVDDIRDDARGKTRLGVGYTDYQDVKPPAITIVWIMRIL